MVYKRSKYFNKYYLFLREDKRNYQFSYNFLVRKIIGVDLRVEVGRILIVC